MSNTTQFSINRFEIKGDEGKNEDKIEELLKVIYGGRLPDKNDSSESWDIWFSDTIPAPAMVKGIENDLSKLDCFEDYEIEEPYPDRLGLVKTGEFTKEVEERMSKIIGHKRLERVAAYIAKSPYFEKDKPIEDCLQKCLREVNDPIDEGAQDILNLLSDDADIYMHMGLGVRISCYDDWKREHWGTTWESTGSTILAFYDWAFFSLEFSTLDSPPDQWFIYLSEYLHEINSDLYISLDYAIEDTWQGAKLEWHIEDGFNRHEYCDDEIKERLCLDER